MAIRLEDPVTSGGTAVTTSGGHRSNTRLETDLLDLSAAPTGGWSERLGEKLSGLHPILACVLVVAAGFVVLAAIVVGFGFLLTDVLLPGDLQRWDSDAVRALADGRPTFNTATLAGRYVGEFATVLAVGGVTLAVCMWKRWWSLASLFLIAISLEGLTYLTATYFVTRNRPNVPRLEHLINSDSYPSGHVAASVVLWVFVALIVWSTTSNRLARGAALFMAVVGPIVVAVSRMYQGMHHPTDAIVGYLIGWGCVGIALTAVRTANIVRDRRARVRSAAQ